MKNIINKPFGLYVLWVVICLAYCVFGLALSTTSDSSAQIPFVVGGFTVVGLICGIFLISIFNMFYSKRILYVNIVAAILTGSIIIYFLIKMITLK